MNKISVDISSEDIDNLMKVADKDGSGYID